MDERSKLLGFLAAHAYQYRPDDPFVLASGRTSPEYLDCKLALSQPGAMVALGNVFLAKLQRGVQAIGGLTMGSDPIAVGTSYASASSDHPVRWFTVRKEPKVHGQKKLIEGSVTKGESVAVVDDVVTSGDSTIRAIDACREFGLDVVQVIVLVDREQADGMKKIRKSAGESVDVSVIFTKEAIKARWIEQNPNPTRLTLVKAG
jgi:orotate phosphoribosyltransferase